MSFSFKDRTTAEVLRDAAFLLAGNEFAGTNQQSLSGSDQTDLGQKDIVLFMGTVKDPSSAQSKSGTGVSATYTMGCGTVYPMLINISEYAPDTVVTQCSDADFKLAAEQDIENSGNEVVTVYNPSNVPYAADELVPVIQTETCWMVIPTTTSENDPAPKRCKFKLLQPTCREGVNNSGFANAEIIDTMNSGLPMGYNITVWDYKRQFTQSDTDSIGMACLYIQFNDPERWHIEWCEQLVYEVEGTLSASLGPWMTAQPTLMSIKPLSSWPYTGWHDSEDGVTINFPQNPRGLVAGNGKAKARRQLLDYHLPDPDNQTAPYTLNPISPTWEIYEVEFPTARWVDTKSTKTTWLIQGDQYAEGESPLAHSEFEQGDEAKPPPGIHDALTEGEMYCHIPLNTKGWAFLDNWSGTYVTITSPSAFFGVPTKANIVGKLNAIATDKLIDGSDSECGLGEYERINGTIVWGDQGGIEPCKLENVDPPEAFDVLKSATEIDVVTSIEIDENGNLKMNTETIKACPEGSGSTVLPLLEMDVVNNVYCSGDSLVKDYKTIKFLGKELAGNTAVQIDTSCIDIDYTQIIYPDYPYIDYYDIIWPEGCDPCPDEDPLGCCTYDGGEGMLTNADCDLVGGSWAGPGVECGGGDCTGSACCCGSFSAVTISLSCPPGAGGPGPGPGPSNVSWEFVSLGTAEGDGSCNWTVNGQWTITDDMGGTTTVAGTVSLTHDGGGSFSGSGSVDGNSFSLSSNPNSADWDGGVPCSNSGQWTYTMDEEIECENE